MAAQTKSPALAGDPGFQHRYRGINSTNSGKPAPRFRPDRLPDVEAFYRGQFQQLKASGKGWALTLCPFHDDRRASFAVHLSKGAFICHACGAKGGDLVDFVKLRDGGDFVTACKTLRAWL